MLLCDRHQEAIALLKAVIKEAPNLPAAWHTMGWVHEARGNIQKALDFFMVSAHLSKVSFCYLLSAFMPTMASTQRLYGITMVCIDCDTGFSQQACPAVYISCIYFADSGLRPYLTLKLLQDSQEWKRIAKLSTEQGHLRQAIYCYKNVSELSRTC